MFSRGIYLSAFLLHFPIGNCIQSNSRSECQHLLPTDLSSGDTAGSSVYNCSPSYTALATNPQSIVILSPSLCQVEQPEQQKNSLNIRRVAEKTTLSLSISRHAIKVNIALVPLWQDRTKQEEVFQYWPWVCALGNAGMASHLVRRLMQMRNQYRPRAILQYRPWAILQYLGIWLRLQPKGRFFGPFWMNFLKTSKQPVTPPPPPSFRKTIMHFFATNFSDWSKSLSRLLGCTFGQLSLY